MKGQIFRQSGLTLTDLIQVLCSNGTTACLKLESRNVINEIDINIREGRIINVECASGLRDADAMLAALSVPEWNFELLPELCSAEERIDEDPTRFLMECTLGLDEDRDVAVYKKIRTQSLTNGGEKTGAIPRSTHGQDMILMPHYAEVIGEALGLGAFRYLVFEENHALVAIRQKPDKVERHTFSESGLGELSILLYKLEVECA